MKKQISPPLPREDSPKKDSRSRIPMVKNEAGLRNAPEPVPVAGIGASAGGLEAMEVFFRNMPPDPGIAFVIVQHFDPHYKGILTELLQRCTSMKVAQVKDRMKVLPDCVYIIPPNADLSISANAFHLHEAQEKQGIRHPIDFFFRSLADDRKERSICIVLSGMGTDGTLGLRAIKENNGMAMVQDPKSAKYDGMPRSAVETGLADYIAPVEELPAKLIEYVRYVSKAPGERLPPDGKTLDALAQIFQLIESRTGHDFTLYKKSSIIRRLERRLNVHQIGTLSDYVRYLRENPQEIDLLCKELLIGVTNFFRDPAAYNILKTKYLPELFKGKASGAVIRVWVPGCSTGEEAYSIAIVLRECLDKAGLGGKYGIQIFATDIDKEAIVKARKGIFSTGISADVSPDRLERFFTKQEDGYRIRKEIRDMLVFSVQNVISDPPLSKIDLISCRNLLIYFTSELQKRVVSIFYQALNPSGILFLGSSETTGNFATIMPSLDKKWKIYRKKEGGTLPKEMRDIAPHLPASPRMPVAEPASGDREPSVPDLVRAALVEDFAPPAVIVNADGDIVYISGRTGKYLEPPAGKANWNIAAMAREGLRFEIRDAVRKAAARKQTVSVEGINVKVNGGEQRIRLTVRPLKPDQSEPLMVVFEEMQAPEEIGKGEQGKSIPGSPKAEQELRKTKEHLHATLEDMRMAQERFRATSEELETSNEELQSTNEELISSKEEMQSLNEELLTVNAELQTKVDALLQAESDIKNLLNSTEIAAVFLDTALKIRRFTPLAPKLIKLIQGDVGRPITDISSNLKYERLGEDVRNVLDSLASKELQVETQEGAWYLMRILPYRTLDNVIQGTVITFTDITAIKRMEEHLDASRRYAENVIATVREPFLVLDAGFRIVSANRSFYRTFRTTLRETEKKSLFELGNRQWDIPALRELLEKIIFQQGEFEGFRVEHTFPKIGRKTMLLNARLLRKQNGGEDMILLAIEDISQKKTEPG